MVEKFSDILERFITGSPVCVMVRATMERISSPQWLDDLFERSARTQYTRTLLFSTVFDLMAHVVLRVRPSMHAAYQAADGIEVSTTAVYDELHHLEPGVCAALVRESGQEVVALIFCVALVAFNLMALVYAALRAVHGAQILDEELSGYYLANDLQTVPAGMELAVPAAEWRLFADMSRATFARFILQLAQAVNLARYRKHRRGAGMTLFLNMRRVRFEAFRPFTLDSTGRLQQLPYAAIERQGRPVRSLESSKTDEEAVAREITRRESARTRSRRSGKRCTCTSMTVISPVLFRDAHGGTAAGPQLGCQRRPRTNIAPASRPPNPRTASPRPQAHGPVTTASRRSGASAAADLCSRAARHDAGPWRQ